MKYRRKERGHYKGGGGEKVPNKASAKNLTIELSEG